MGIRKNIHNLSQGPPNPGFMQEKVQKGDFLKKDSRESNFFSCFRFLWISWRPGTLNWEQVFFWLSKNQYSQYEYICFAVQPDKKSYFASMVNHVPASRCHPCFDKQRWNVGCILPMYLLSTRYTFSTYLARSWKIKCTFWLKPKLYSQSTINIWRKLIRTAIWTDRNGLVSVSVTCM